MQAPNLYIPINESFGIKNKKVKDGMYMFEVLDYKLTSSKKGEPLLSVKVRLDTGELWTIPFVLTNNSVSRLCEFLVSIGVKERGIPVVLADVLEKIIGKTGMCYITNGLALRFIYIHDLIEEKEELDGMFIDYYSFFLNEDIKEGNRNNMLFRAALSAIASGRSTEPLFEKAIKIGLTPQEAEQTIKSAYKIDTQQRNVYRLWYNPVSLNSYISDFGDAYDPATLYKQFVEQINTMFRQDELILIATISKDGEQKQYSYSVYSFSELLDPDFRVPDNAVIMINPVKDRNATGKVEDVSSFRYAIIECDNIPLNKQLEFWKKSDIPVDFVVYSGNKSLHAFVRIDAENYDEWRDTVEVLKKYLSIRKFEFDKSLLHPAAKGRLAGSFRDGVPQFIVLKKSGIPIKEFVKRYSDKSVLPKIVSFNQLENRIKNSPPPPVLIDGVIRCYSTMVLGGEPKVGKTMLLLNLVCALSCGGEWLGRKVRKAKSLFINMEVDDYVIYERLSHILEHYPNADKDSMYFLHLRGCELGFEDLFKYIENSIFEIGGVDVVIVDPVYKLFLGDENSAKEVSRLVTLIDRHFISNGVTFIFAHHLNKGSADKNSYIPLLSRLSGSGVFTRYPEALLYITKHDRNIRVDYYLRCFEQPAPEVFEFVYPIYRRIGL